MKDIVSDVSAANIEAIRDLTTLASVNKAVRVQQDWNQCRAGVSALDDIEQLGRILPGRYKVGSIFTCSAYMREPPPTLKVSLSSAVKALPSLVGMHSSATLLVPTSFVFGLKPRFSALIRCGVVLAAAESASGMPPGDCV